VASAWKPLGRIFKTEAMAPWAVSHASHPLPLGIGQNRLRIYFSTRDEQNRSSAASIEVDIDGERFDVVRGPEGPHFGPGKRGFFDADGVTMSSFVRNEGRLFGFYLGWTVLKHVPFANFIGLCVSDDDGATFQRVSTVPIVGRTRENPITIGYPFVIREGGRWRMWYGSHLSWDHGTQPMLHVLKEAFSDNLLDWQADERVVIDVAGSSVPEEFAVSRPCVVREPDETLSMWYATRRPNYELGYAVSRDANNWERRDHSMQFLGQTQAWENCERTYPFVFDHNGRRYMLYNGNGYGREGFGIAILEP